MNLDKWQKRKGLSDSDILSPRYLERIKSEPELVQCACGCGGWRPRYDRRGKARHYLRGHRPPRSRLPRNKGEIDPRVSGRAPPYPKIRITQIMEALESEPLNINELSKKAGVSWMIARKYLSLIEWIQNCPQIRSGSGGKRIKTYRREWGKLPD